ncbi:DUF4352 domain-containing protein [Actinocorallia populi]|uniref:DUF4352 domain-containing protein n=1 Tax=Actinocorallia populi TaxID=2079200 RepID=UPI000D097986|nr:DUF4352 domain-containing protein [Actinocorallia populi]
MAEKGSWNEGGGTGREPGQDRAASEEASGSTAEGGPPRRGFNPAWLLVPAAGLLLGGLGIAGMNRDQGVGSKPTVTVTGPPATVVRPVAPVGTSTTAPGCDLDFRGTELHPPVSRLPEGSTGRYQQAPSGRAFVVVDTTLTNSGTEDCYATPGYQRVHTSGNTYYTGNGEAGALLPGGNAVKQAIPAGRSVKGAYVFQVPAGSAVSSVRLRSNGSEQWTIVNAG